MSLAIILRGLNTASVCSAQKLTSSCVLCLNYDQNRFVKSVPPKKPANTYLMYRAEVAEEILDKNPGLTSREVSKMIGEQYRSLSKQKMETLTKEYTKKLKEFHRELLDWERSHPNMEKLKNLKEIEKILGKPVKPSNQTNKFISNYLLTNEKSGFKEAYEAWNKLPPAEKEAQKKDFDQEYKAYKIKLSKWEKSLSESDRKLLEEAKESQMKPTDIEKKLGKPVKPANHFAKFVAEYILKNENRGFKEAGEAWKNLAAAKKEILKKEYDEEFKDYKMKLQKWEASLSEADRELLDKAGRSKTVNTAEDKVESPEIAKPKRPPNAHNLFIKEHIAENNCLLKDAVEAWKSLGQKKKETYEKEAKAMMEVYEEELLLWEKEMMAAGRTDLVRKSKLKSLKS